MAKFDNGCCNKISAKTDPLTHVLLHGADPDLKICLEGNHQAFTWRRILMRACEEIRGRRYNWVPRRILDQAKQKSVDKFLIWSKHYTPYPLENYQTLRAWAKSDHSFVAPSRWPSRVSAAFAPFPVPSPYRLANTDFLRLGRAYMNHNVMTLMAYASGVRVRTIGDWYLQQPDVVVHQMTQGVHSLLKDPRFKVWLVNLDWTKMNPPTSLGNGILTRLSNAARLKHNPLLVSPITAQGLTNSPQFIAWACSKEAKKVNPLLVTDENRIFWVAPPGAGN